VLIDEPHISLPHQGSVHGLKQHWRNWLLRLMLSIVESVKMITAEPYL
jgi:hypothetical protein